MKVLGIDPGSKSWDFFGLNDDKIILDTSIPSKELIQEPQKAITIIVLIALINLGGVFVFLNISKRSNIKFMTKNILSRLEKNLEDYDDTQVRVQVQ